MQQIKNDFERISAHNIRRKAADLQNANELDKLVELVNDTLAEFQIADRIDKTHIRFYGDFIGNILPPVLDKKLSHIIFEHSFPKPNLKQYYHFTNYNAALSILGSGKLRLSNLRRRFKDGEFEEFYSHHGITGYKSDRTTFGISYSEKDIMSEIFFLSLSGMAIDMAGDNKWELFGDSGAGCRLTIEVEPKHNDFREVYYSKGHTKAILLVKVLSDRIEARYQKPFNFSYISKIGAFYIKGDFKNEDEYRFLIKTTSDEYGAAHLKPIVTDAQEKIAYLELALENEFATFKITEVQPGYDCSDEDIAELSKLIQKKKPAIKLLNRALKNYGI